MEIKYFLEFKVHEGTAYLNSWDTMKVVLREKFMYITECTYKKILKKFYTSTVISYLKALE